MTSRVPPILRASSLLLGAGVVAAAAEAATQALRAPTQAFSDLLLAAAAWLLLGCSTWAVVLCAALVAEAVSSGRLRATAWVGCPPRLRRLLLTVLGVTLASGLPVAASARGELPAPARPTDGQHLVRLSGPGGTLAVRPGDTLWGLAASRLPSTAGDGAIASLVARLHRENRRVIGPDPDHIEPGQRLTLPASLTRTHEEKP